MDIPILLYHRISDAHDRTSLCVTPERFAQQMAYLASNGYKVVSLYDVIAHKNGRIKLPHKAVSITFDDGYEDNFTVAYPILSNHGFPATIFLVADLVGDISRWDEVKSLPSAPLMTWDQVIKMSKNGMTFGSHGLRHIRLTKPKLTPFLLAEIMSSKKIIETKIKKTIDFFSYPYGKYNWLLSLLVRLSGYKGACILSKSVQSPKSSSEYALDRVEINADNSNLSDFVKIVEKSARPKLSILQICTNNSWGGQELYPVILTKKLKQRGHKMAFALRRGSPIESKVKRNGLITKYVKIKGSFDLKSIVSLVFLIKKHKIDIVHAHTSKDYYSCVIASKLAGAKLVITRHLLTPLHNLTLRMVRRADAVIAVSNAVRDTMIRDGIIKSGDIRVIYNGVDTSVFHPDDKNNEAMRAKFGFKKDDFVIGNIGHMGCKGQQELIPALKRVCDKYPNTKCLFVAEKPTVTDLEQLAEDLGIRKNIVFEGYREDIPEIMKMLDLFVIAPKLEAFGIVLIEAMACAKPVIATHTGGIPEVVKDKLNGLLISYKDISALSDAIIYMIDNRQEAVKMGLNGYKIAGEYFDINKSLDKIENIYYEVLFK